jgi:hypothetical protein
LRGLVKDALDVRGNRFMDGGLSEFWPETMLASFLGVGVDQKTFSLIFGRNGGMYCQGRFPAAAFAKERRLSA